MQYSDAADALSCARNEEVRKHIRTDIKVIFAEIQNRDTELAALRTELAKANAKAHEVGRILAGLSWQLMGKDE